MKGRRMKFYWKKKGYKIKNEKISIQKNKQNDKYTGFNNAQLVLTKNLNKIENWREEQKNPQASKR